MFDNINFSLAAAVADNGTVTVGYPTGRTKGNYSLNTGAHLLIVGQNKYVAPADFTLTFNANASNITLTNKSGNTWPASAAVMLQAERSGDDSGTLKLVQSVLDRSRVIPMLPTILDLGSPGTIDADGISVSQSVVVATTPLATITGALASGGAVVFDVPRNVVAAWTGTAIVTITGKDEYGTVMVEKSASGTSLTGLKAFKQVTAVSFSANVTSATVGSGEKLGLPIAIRSGGQILAELKDGVIVGRPSGKARINFYADVTDTGVGTAAAPEIIAPFTGVISSMTVIVRTAIVTGGDVTAKVGTTDVVGLTCTVANSATKGTAVTDTPTAGDATTVVNKGDRIQIVIADAFNGGGDLDGYIEITPTNSLTDGALVIADALEATATTGDVRGTYTPVSAADGSAGWRLLALLPDPNDLGVAQFAG